MSITKHFAKIDVINKDERIIFMKSKGTKLYNIGFSPLFLYIFPQLWFISLPVNFIIDSLVLLVGFKLFGKEKVLFNYRKSIWKTWLFGYLADLIGAAVQIEFEMIADMDFYRGSVMTNPLGGIFPFFATLVSVAVSGILIYVFNLKICLNTSLLEEKNKKKTALLIALCTAPYMFFMPVMF